MIPTMAIGVVEVNFALSLFLGLSINIKWNVSMANTFYSPLWAAFICDAFEVDWKLIVEI